MIGISEKILRVSGVVVSGLGEGQIFSQIDWVKNQIHDHFGFWPFPGTFNLKIDSRSARDLQRFKNHSQQVQVIPPSSGYCVGMCLPAKVTNQIKGAYVWPVLEGYPDDIIEIMAPVNLRDALGVNNGDKVSLTIYSVPGPGEDGAGEG